jgi:predicted SAM-dependent methyltransferase
MGMKLHIGGSERRTGWTVVNIASGDHVDIVADCRAIPVEPNTCDEVYASHVLEHIQKAEVGKTLRHWHDLLVPGGRLRVAVPDLQTLCRLYVDDRISTYGTWQLVSYIYGGQTNAHDYHRCGFSEDTLRSALEETGYAEIRQVAEFGEFRDCSYAHFLNGSISLNMEAIKPCEPNA